MTIKIYNDTYESATTLIYLPLQVINIVYNLITLSCTKTVLSKLNITDFNFINILIPNVIYKLGGCVSAINNTRK